MVGFQLVISVNVFFVVLLPDYITSSQILMKKIQFKKNLTVLYKKN